MYFVNSMFRICSDLWNVLIVGTTPVSPTCAKCNQSNVKQLKQAVQVCEVKRMVQKRNTIKWQYEQ